MRKIALIVIIPLMFYACRKENTREIIFYKDSLSKNVVCLANPITYNVILKNYDPEDNWNKQALKNVNADTLINILLEGVLQKKIVATSFLNDDSIIPFDSIRNLKGKIKNLDIITFEEQWFFDPESFEFYKKINSIVIGYNSQKDLSLPPRFKAIFKIKINEKN